MRVGPKVVRDSALPHAILRWAPPAPRTMICRSGVTKTPTLFTGQFPSLLEISFKGTAAVAV